ncbi:hypothetical protein DSO57_1025153 [Entomophthora muscae]|uniref:Uncharacterized protein n=1 Tax=Entomophthora muscae TaxID=34485 RepID=A0ACC2TPM2_9FUNG|nr:hypothetical protein DSO57_1025153 [Entomophthora muscae]
MKVFTKGFAKGFAKRSTKLFTEWFTEVFTKGFAKGFTKRSTKKALVKYNLNAPAQVAFFLSIISVETGNLTFNKNIWPSCPGQGAHSMMMPINLHAFLKDSPNILTSHPFLCSIAEKPYEDTNDKAKTDVLDVLMQPKYSFEPGAWWIQKGAEKIQPGFTCFYSTLESKVTVTTLDTLLKSCVDIDPTEAWRQAFETALKAITIK